MSYVAYQLHNSLQKFNNKRVNRFVRCKSIRSFSRLVPSKTFLIDTILYRKSFKIIFVLSYGQTYIFLIKADKIRKSTFTEFHSMHFAIQIILSADGVDSSWFFTSLILPIFKREKS